MNKVLIVMCMVFLCMHTGLACAQETTSISEARRIAAPGQPVALGNKTVLTLKERPGLFRAGKGAYSH